MLHREDGPAIEYSTGTKKWYKYGCLHREDGPAEEYSDGSKLWYKNGKLHREDGPATIKHLYGIKGWWLNDICYGKNDEFTNESWEFFINTLIFS